MSRDLEQAAASDLVRELEALWAAIRRRHPDVPPAVIVVGAGSGDVRRGELKLGHFARDRWTRAEGEGPAIAEVFFGGEGFKLGALELLDTALHEAAHGIAAVRGIQETSRQGRYHNARFRKLAEEVGLTAQTAGSIGWSYTELAEGTAAEYADELVSLEAALQLVRRHEVQPAAGAKPPGQIACVCGCLPPRKIRVTPSVFDLGPIECGLCVQPFAPAES